GTARRDHGYARELADRGDQLEVEALFGAVGVDRVHEELAGAALNRLARPLERIDIGLAATAVGRHDEAARRVRCTLDVEREHEALRAVTVRDLAQERGSGDARGIDADL